MQFKVMLVPNKFGYYGISYFDGNKKFHHFVMDSVKDIYTWIYYNYGDFVILNELTKY